MITSIDRIQIATADAEGAAAPWKALLGAEFLSRDKVGALKATRVTYRLGGGAIEFLEPDGGGVIDDALRTRGRAHLFAAGVASKDFEGTVARLRSKGVETAVEHGQAFFNPVDAVGVDCPMVLSPAEERPAVGHIDFLYEVTLLVPDAEETVRRITDLFGLDDGHYSPIESERFGYTGVLTLFNSDDLQRFEVITPTSEETTMGRFFKRCGTSYYMAYAETSEIGTIEEKTVRADTGITVNRPEDRSEDLPADQMWLHPSSLGGMMLWLSRPSMAWFWSGHPERVQAIE